MSKKRNYRLFLFGFLLADLMAAGVLSLEELKDRIPDTVYVRYGREEGLQEGIRAFILDNLEEQIPEARILSKLERRFSLTPEQAKEYFEKYAEGC